MAESRAPTRLMHTFTSQLLGTALNATAALLGALLGLFLARPPQAARQAAVKSLLGILLIWVGLGTTWMHLGGGFGPAAKQFLIVMLAMTLGQLTGRLLRLQKGLNRLGQYARDQFTRLTPGQPAKFGDGFVTCAILFCATPLSVLGALMDGLSHQWYTLGLKAVLDGFAALSFARSFRWATVLAIVPLVAIQGSVALGAGLLAPWLKAHGLIDSIGATTGLLIFSVSLLVLEIRKVRVADYLPSLIFAPLLTWLW